MQSSTSEGAQHSGIYIFFTTWQEFHQLANDGTKLNFS